MSAVVPTLTPAYGRDYKSKKEVIAAFNAGKDFIYNDLSSPYDGKYCSIRDLQKGKVLRFRYKQLTEVFEYIV